MRDVRKIQLAGSHVHTDESGVKIFRCCRWSIRLTAVCATFHTIDATSVQATSTYVPARTVVRTVVQSAVDVGAHAWHGIVHTHFRTYLRIHPLQYVLLYVLLLR